MWNLRGFPCFAFSKEGFLHCPGTAETNSNICQVPLSLAINCVSLSLRVSRSGLSEPCHEWDPLNATRSSDTHVHGIIRRLLLKDGHSLLSQACMRLSHRGGTYVLMCCDSHSWWTQGEFNHLLADEMLPPTLGLEKLCEVVDSHQHLRVVRWN